MANSITQYTYILDTDGIISKKTLRIAKAILYPNAGGDSVTFKSWYEGQSPKTTQSDNTTTATADPYLQSTGNFTTALVAAGDVIKILRTNTGNNIDTFSVATRDNDNQITLDGYPTLTAEASKVYTWKVWTPQTIFQLVSPGTEVTTTEIDFTGLAGGGLRLPTLFMDGLSSSASVHLILA